MKLSTGPVFLALIGLTSASFAQESALQPPPVIRKIEGRSVVSPELPRARLTVAPGFRYLAGQSFLLPGPTAAEQQFFVDAGPDGMIRRLYWLQFEHKMPGNNGSYNYPQARRMDVDGHTFVYDTKVYTDYAGQQVDAGSDFEKMFQMIAAHGLSFPKTATRIRMFNKPGGDTRSELMIEYIEAVPDVPADAGNDMPADDRYPAVSQALLGAVHRTLKIQ